MFKPSNYVYLWNSIRVVLQLFHNRNTYLCKMAEIAKTIGKSSKRNIIDCSRITSVLYFFKRLSKRKHKYWNLLSLDDESKSHRSFFIRLRSFMLLFLVSSHKTLKEFLIMRKAYNLRPKSPLFLSFKMWIHRCNHGKKCWMKKKSVD